VIIPCLVEKKSPLLFSQLANSPAGDCTQSGTFPELHLKKVKTNTSTGTLRSYESNEQEENFQKEIIPFPVEVFVLTFML